ncbi:MAG: ABC transporter permease [Thermoplasmata archaeon]|nr:ABC transporter permease [Thermoplasmata archaeon]
MLVLFIAIPIIAMIGGTSLDSLGRAFGESAVRDAILLSVSTAFYATLIAIFVGVPLGYLLARKSFIGKSLVQAVVDLPIVIPHTVAGIALLTVFGSQGLIGSSLEPLGIKFVDAVPGIVIAMLFVSVPFVINSAKNGFQSVDPKLENVARSLGASQHKAFTSVAVPLASRNIMTGAIMCWARAVSEFGAVIVLVYWPMIAPTLIYDRYTGSSGVGGLAAARPIAVLLILVCLLVFFGLSILVNWKRKR